ncbi:hypothetical protein NDU88_000583 [Pleurodeles waltl]|uniref:Uncharacterized protein n=1 Tax=Pleurodeles waltl TaxID=8319 RepID=A0AAV7S5N2_PLEWA|nr:hypothetical protein NDU88_000583 [Pleurodeles waltl]
MYNLRTNFVKFTPKASNTINNIEANHTIYACTPDGMSDNKDSLDLKEMIDFVASSTKNDTMTSKFENLSDVYEVKDKINGKKSDFTKKVTYWKYPNKKYLCGDIMGTFKELKKHISNKNKGCYLKTHCCKCDKTSEYHNIACPYAKCNFGHRKNFRSWRNFRKYENKRNINALMVPHFNNRNWKQIAEKRNDCRDKRKKQAMDVDQSSINSDNDTNDEHELPVVTAIERRKVFINGKRAPQIINFNDLNDRLSEAQKYSTNVQHHEDFLDLLEEIVSYISENTIDINLRSVNHKGQAVVTGTVNMNTTEEEQQSTLIENKISIKKRQAQLKTQ